MKWITHKRITKEVMNRIGLMPLPRAEYKKLMDGVVAPDKWRDNNPHFPHHYGRSNEIQHHLLEARRLFLQNDLPNALFNLGVALHYIQDSYTSYPSFSQIEHGNWEERIENSCLVSDLETTIQRTVRDVSQRNRCSWRDQELMNEVQGRDNTLGIAILNGGKQENDSIASPEVDLNLGFRASYVVSKSILGPKNCPALDNQLRSVLSEHENRLRMAEIESSNKITRLISERDELARKKVPPNGILGKIKNWVTGIRIGSKDRAVISNMNGYFRGEHLENVAKHYMTEASKTAANYGGWYDFQIPQLDLNIVSRELLEIQAVSKILSFDQHNLRNLLKERNISIHPVGDNEIVRRTDLDRLLLEIPINGFIRYPA